MMDSDEYSSYVFRIKFYSVTTVIFMLAACAVCVAIFVFIKLMTKSLLRATARMRNAAKILKIKQVDPTVVGVIAVLGRKGTNVEKVRGAYDKMGSNAKKLVGRVFRMDVITRDFIKLFDSKYLAANAEKDKDEGKTKKKKGSKAKKSSKNDTKKSKK